MYMYVVNKRYVPFEICCQLKYVCLAVVGRHYNCCEISKFNCLLWFVYEFRVVCGICVFELHRLKVLCPRMMEPHRPSERWTTSCTDGDINTFQQRLCVLSQTFAVYPFGHPQDDWTGVCPPHAHTHNGTLSNSPTDSESHLCPTASHRLRCCAAQLLVLQNDSFGFQLKPLKA